METADGVLADESNRVRGKKASDESEFELNKKENKEEDW